MSDKISHCNNFLHTNMKVYLLFGYFDYVHALLCDSRYLQSKLNNA